MHCAFTLITAVFLLAGSHATLSQETYAIDGDAPAMSAPLAPAAGQKPEQTFQVSDNPQRETVDR